MPNETKTPVDEKALPDWIAEHLEDPALVSVVAKGGWRFAAAFFRAAFLNAKQREADLEVENAKLRAEVGELKHQIMGQKSETCSGNDAVVVNTDGGQVPNKRPRGAQKGHPHHRRKKRPHLPTQTRRVALPNGIPCCSKCGKPFTVYTRQSERFEVHVRMVRVVHEVEEAMRACSCSVCQPPVRATPPPNIIPKSLFDTSLWIEVILAKFYLHIPLARILSSWSLSGLELSEGVLVNGLKRLAPLFDPVFELIAAHQREHGNRLQADETGWPVFGDPRQESGRNRWQLWVFRGPETVVFLIKPSRAADVILDHLPENVVAILLVDRYSSYKKSARLLEGLVLAFCWAHVRRDFVSALRSYGEEIGNWAREWIKEIGNLFHLEKQRQQALEKRIKENSSEIEIEVTVEDLPEHQLVEEHLQGMKGRRVEQLEKIDQELDDDQLKLGERGSQAKAKQRLALKTQKRILESLDNHWEGLILFLEYPEIPLDNNASERALRGAAVARKNYYGSGAEWSLALTAKLFSIFATLEIFGINVRTWLGHYFGLCSKNGGQAPASEQIEKIMPWQMDESTLEGFGRPPPLFEEQVNET